MSFDEMLEQILKNNEDYIKFVEQCGSEVESSVVKRTKHDLLKFSQVSE